MWWHTSGAYATTWLADVVAYPGDVGAYQRAPHIDRDENRDPCARGHSARIRARLGFAAISSALGPRGTPRGRLSLLALSPAWPAVGASLG